MTQPREAVPDPPPAGGKVEERKPSSTSTRLFYGVIIAGLAVRCGVFLGSQRWLNWDECILALAAKDVLHGQFILYFPTQAYGGGASIETLACALLFAVFGVSATAVKVYALLCHAATLALLGHFVRRVWGTTAACWAVALWATAPALAVFSLQVRAGYIEIQLFAVLVLLAFHRAVHQAEARLWHFAALGLAAGLAYYFFGLVLPLLLSLPIVVFAWDKGFAWRPRWLIAAAGLLIGLSPMIYFDLTHDFAHVKWVLSQGGGTFDLPSVWRIVSYELPMFFQPHLESFLGRVPWACWPPFAATTLLGIGWAWSARSDVKRTAAQVFRRASTPLPWPAGLETAMLIYVAMYFVFYLAGPPRAPRYFLGLYPVTAVGLGVTMARYSHRILMMVPGCVLVLSGFLVNVHLMDLPGVRGVFGRPKLNEMAAVHPGGILEVRDWLLERGIKNVFAHPVIKWKLMFYSDEAIRGSSMYSTYQDDGKHLEKLEAMEASLQKGEPYAFVFHSNFGYQGPQACIGIVGNVAVPATDPGALAYYAKFVPSNPAGSAQLEAVPYPYYFRDVWRRAGITLKTERIGDYGVVHGFEGVAALIALRPIQRWQAYVPCPEIP